MDKKHLQLLVCPLTKQALEYHPEQQELWSRAASWHFLSETASPSCCRMKPARWTKRIWRNERTVSCNDSGAAVVQQAA